MNELLTLTAAAVAGGVLGAMFFGGLWWTIQKGKASNHPAPWFLGSLVLRMSLALAGFYVVSGGHWERLAACLLGFVIARVIVTRIYGNGPLTEHHNSSAREAGHAS